MSAEYASLPAMLKSLCTRSKPPNNKPNNFLLDEEKFNQDGKTNMQNDR